MSRKRFGKGEKVEFAFPLGENTRWIGATVLSVGRPDGDQYGWEYSLRLHFSSATVHNVAHNKIRAVDSA